MSNQKSFAQQVREKYGDTVREFSFRLGVSEYTINKWEKNSPTTTLHTALLEYANTYEMSMKPEPPAHFVQLPPAKKIEWLMRYFGCGIDALAARLRIDKSTVRDWKRKNRLSSPAKRYLDEMATHPENFMLFK